ncbi:MAG: PAS domain-containing sensor histidine kinase [Thermotaleaceae bacterium]
MDKTKTPDERSSMAAPYFFKKVILLFRYYPLIALLCGGIFMYAIHTQRELFAFWGTQIHSYKYTTVMVIHALTFILLSLLILICFFAYRRINLLEETLSQNQKYIDILRENNEIHTQLFKSAHDAILIMELLDNEDMKYHQVNDFACSLVGYSREELLSLSPSQIISDSNFLHKMNETVLQNGFAVLETWMITKDNLSIPVKIHGQLYSVYGKKFILSIARDLRARNKNEIEKETAMLNLKILQQTIEYDRLKIEFLSNVSHEFKTPLNLILGTLQLCEFHLQKDSVLLPFSNYMKVIKQNSYRLLRLIDNLIDINEIELGYTDIYYHNHDLLLFTKQITFAAAEVIKKKGIEIDFQSNVNQKIMACDGNKIEKILLNLLSNATKFSRPGDRILITFNDYGERVEISVKDTGIGIPEDKQKLIFQRFRQIEPLMTRTHEGAGIGLSLVKLLVQMHGGTISLESQIDKGSTFTISLPVVYLEGSFSCQEHMDKDFSKDKVSVEFSDIY